MFYVIIYALWRESDITKPFKLKISLSASQSVLHNSHFYEKKLDVSLFISGNNKAGPYYVLISLLDEYYDVISLQIPISNCWPDKWACDIKRSHRTLTIFLQF